MWVKVIFPCLPPRGLGVIWLGRHHTDSCSDGGGRRRGPRQRGVVEGRTTWRVRGITRQDGRKSGNQLNLDIRVWHTHTTTHTHTHNHTHTQPHCPCHPTPWAHLNCQVGPFFSPPSFLFSFSSSTPSLLLR